MQTSNTKKTGIIIADDHELVLTGLRIIINNSENFHIIGQARGGVELLELIESMEGSQEIAILVLDLYMQNMVTSDKVDLHQPEGLLALRKIKERWPAIKVLVMTQEKHPQMIRNVLESGADGYLLKDGYNDAILIALKDIMQGKRVLAPEVEQIIQNASNDETQQLTRRENQILEMVVAGLKDKEISERLDISIRTVAFHKANLKEKLAVDTTAELINYYYQSR